ncbi:MAG: CoA transferase [Candidatus Obscuribacter sp.]|nr:CoA transferase [Candidatus Obscuribacter sp.]
MPDTQKTLQRFWSTGALGALDAMVKMLGLDSACVSEITMHNGDPLVRSPHHLAESTAYALLLEAMAVSSIWKYRCGTATALEIDCLDAIHALHSTHFLWQSGYPLSVGAEFVPTNGIYACRDGRYIMIEAGPPYVKLERGYLNFFDCGNNRESIARSIARYDGEDLQEKLSAAGLPACLAYNRQEWLDHPQGQVLSQTPLIEIEKIADGKPVGLKGEAAYPLSGIRVIDFTHVLAGPRSMRSLAQYGAEVLHISSPYHRDTVSQNLLVNMGKRSAYLLLTEAEKLKEMKALTAQADVFACSYRPSVRDRFDLSPKALAAQSEGIVCLSINAYGHSGPWSERPGFDQNAQVATGFAATEGGADKPRFSPVFYLNDFLTGYLASAGVMRALELRARDGGSYHVKVSLARTAMWVQDLGYIDKSDYIKCPEGDDYPPRLRTVDTVCGSITELSPAVSFSYMPRLALDNVQPFGADKPVWQD